MAKGFFTQGLVILTNGKLSIDEIKAALQTQRIQIVKQNNAAEHWQFSGPGLLIPFLPEVNGYATVDVVNQPWPDSMGDPKTEPVTFAAWGMGHFGPLTFPRSLERAAMHPWVWRKSDINARDHAGFVRIRLSYVLGAVNKDAPVLPPNYSPHAEMNFITRLMLVILEMPGVLGYFNPNGEVIGDQSGTRDFWHACTQQKKIPWQLWTNVRHYKLSEQLGLMDTVGNGQLDIPDVEAVFPSTNYRSRDIDYYLRNVSHYLCGLKRELKTGEAIDGPGENKLSWFIECLDQGLAAPPRRVIRFYPKALRDEVNQAIEQSRKQ